MLRDNAAVLPAEEEEEEGRLATSCALLGASPPSDQVFHQDATHVRHRFLFIVALLLFLSQLYVVVDSAAFAFNLSGLLCNVILISFFGCQTNVSFCVSVVFFLCYAKAI